MSAGGPAYEAAADQARELAQKRTRPQRSPIWTITLAEVPLVIEAALAAERERIAQAIGALEHPDNFQAANGAFRRAARIARTPPI